MSSELIFWKSKYIKANTWLAKIFINIHKKTPPQKYKQIFNNSRTIFSETGLHLQSNFLNEKCSSEQVSSCGRQVGNAMWDSESVVGVKEEVECEKAWTSVRCGHDGGESCNIELRQVKVGQWFCSWDSALPLDTACSWN